MMLFSTKIHPLDESYKEDEDWDIFKDIVYRAEKIINKFTPEEIEKQSKIARDWLSTLDMLLHSPKHGLFDVIRDGKYRGISKLSNAYLIKHSYTRINSNDLKLVNWDLLYALISLYEIDSFMLNMNVIKSGKIAYPNFNKRANFRACALSALEAVLYAETSYEINENIETKVKAKTSANAKKAALKRHEKTQKLYSKFIKFYHDGEFKSKKQAAEMFLETLSNDERILAPTNATRSLLDALRKFQKSLK
jgi:hypothetical protein